MVVIVDIKAKQVQNESDIKHYKKLTPEQVEERIEEMEKETLDFLMSEGLTDVDVKVTIEEGDE